MAEGALKYATSGKKEVRVAVIPEGPYVIPYAGGGMEG